METLRTILREARIVPELTRLLGAGEECFLVGGALRDWLLGRRSSDFDFATPKDPTPLAQAFARAVGGKWFFLDAERSQSRVVVREGGGTRTYDFAPYRGEDLAADQRGRDFTINALALPLSGTQGAATLIDSLGGERDLSSRVLRSCSPDAFSDDPLRLLRGVRHAATLGFRLHPETAEQMRSEAKLLAEAAPERIRSELAAILACVPAAPALEQLRDLDLLETLLGPPADPDGFPKGSRFVSAVERAAAELPAGDLWNEELEDGFSRTALLKLTAFLRGYAPADLDLLLSFRLRLSRHNLALVRGLVDLPAEFGAKLAALKSAGRGRALWAARLGPGPVEALLFLVSLDERLLCSPQSVLGALRDVQEYVCDGRIPDLVDGRWIRETLDLPEGPSVGTALAMLRQAEIEGEVRTAEEARSYLRKNAKKIVDKEGGSSYNP